MNTVRINGQDYTSSLSDAEIAFMGNFSLPTTAQTLSGAIAEHENDISELNSKIEVVEQQYTLSADSVDYWGLRKWELSYSNKIQRSKIVSYMVMSMAGAGAFNNIQFMENAMWLTTHGASASSSGSITIRFLLKNN